MAETNGVSQAGVVPFRISDSGIEFCLITTRKSRRWGFPKGRIRSDESVDEAALNEAREEAGLTGTVIGPPIGSYVYKKGRRKLAVTVLLMRVDGCQDAWKESHERRRKWVAPEKARLLLDRSNLIQLLDNAIERLGSNPRLTAGGIPIQELGWSPTVTDAPTSSFGETDR